MTTNERLWGQHPLFAAIPGLPAQMAAQTEVATFEPGTKLASAGESIRNIVVLLSGVVRLSQRASTLLKMTRLLGAPNTVGDAELLHGIGLLTDVHATTTVEVTSLPAPLFISLLNQHPRFALVHARALAASLCVAVYAEREAFTSLDERAASLVLDYAELLGTEDPGCAIVVPVSNAELARNLGCTRRGLINVMRRWESEGVLDRRPSGELEIHDLPRLEAAAALIRGSRHCRLGGVSKALGRRAEGYPRDGLSLVA